MFFGVTPSSSALSSLKSCRSVASPEGRRTSSRTTRTRSMQRPKREQIPCPQTRIPVINQIQPAISQRTAVGFDLAKRKRVKRAAVLVSDLHNYLVLARSFCHRDYLCRNRAHQGLRFSRSGRLESRCVLLQIRFLEQSPNRGLKLIVQSAAFI